MPTLEEALAKIEELEAKAKGLEDEKVALLRKRDELLKENKDLKTKFEPFKDYAGQDINISELLEIKQKYEQGDSDAKRSYEALYNQDKAKFEQRLAAIEQERQEEKRIAAEREQQAIAAQLKADAIGELSKESYRIRNPEQFWILYGQGKIQRSEEGKLYVGDEYKQVPIGDYINSIADSEDNAHHFKPRGGTGSGQTQGIGGSGRGAIENPFKRGSTWNLTKQGQILKANPELAARLKAEAGNS